MNAILALPNLIDYSTGDEDTADGNDSSSSTSSVTPSNPSLTHDELYNDPAADMKFLSKDRVVFRLSSWHLMKKSGFIRDMLDVTGAKHGIDDYIVLDVSSKTLRYFFPALYGEVTYRIGVSWYHCQRLLKLADQFQAPEIEKTLLLGMSHIGWPVFKIAAEKNFGDVGRACVKQFDKHVTPADSLPDIAYQHKADMTSLSAAWLASLTVCRLSNHYETDKDGVQVRNWWKRKWSDGADYFNV